MKCSLSELRHAVNSILDHVERHAGTDVEIQSESYWQVTASDRYKPYSRPSELELGSLSEDIDSLRKLEAGEFLGHDAASVAALLQVIAFEHPR